MMTGTLDHMIAGLSPLGLQINIWPVDAGFQANVKERAGSGWTVAKSADPVIALRDALRQRASGIATRTVVHSPPQSDEDVDPVEGVQIDIEDAIASVVAQDADDGFDGLLG